MKPGMTIRCCASTMAASAGAARFGRTSLIFPSSIRTSACAKLPTARSSESTMPPLITTRRADWRRVSSAVAFGWVCASAGVAKSVDAPAASAVLAARKFRRVVCLLILSSLNIGADFSRCEPREVSFRLALGNFGAGENCAWRRKAHPAFRDQLSFVDVAVPLFFGETEAAVGSLHDQHATLAVGAGQHFCDRKFRMRGQFVEFPCVAPI